VEDAAKDEVEDENEIIKEEDEIINKVIENEIDTAIIKDTTIALEEGTSAAAAMMMEMTDVLEEEKGNDDLLPSDYPTYSPIHTDYPTYMPTE
jgi:hypothetical protein